jgi:hypothetical protein
MTHSDLSLARIDESVKDLAVEVQDLTRELRGLRSDHNGKDLWGGVFAPLLGGTLLVLLILLAVAAGEAIDVLRDLQ